MSITILRARERSAVYQILCARADRLHSSHAQRQNAIAVATREFNAGRSPAVAAALGLSSLSGRHPALLTQPAS